MSRAPYMSVRECAASSKLRQLSNFLSSGIGPEASHIVSLASHGISDVTGVSGFNSVN